MDTSIAEGDRKPIAITGNHWAQRPLQILAAAPPPAAMQTLAANVLASADFSAVLQFAAQHSGMDDLQIADRIAISPGYMSRFLRSVAQQWAKRLIAFMRATHSLAPLQWMAEQMGCELVVRDTRAAEVAALKARLAEIERAA